MKSSVYRPFRKIVEFILCKSSVYCPTYVFILIYIYAKYLIFKTMRIIFFKSGIIKSCFALFVFIQVCNAQMKVHFIDVGQGSSCLVEFPCSAILIDAGGEKNQDFDSNEALEKYLKNFFKSKPVLKNTLQCLYITHPHIDHTRGIPTLLELKYPIKNLVTNGMETGSGKAQQIKMHKMVEQAEATATTADDIGFEAVTVDEVPKTGLTNKVIDPVKCTEVDPKIRILWGEMIENPGLSNKEFYDENNNSLVIKIEYGSSSIIFTGDLEEKAIAELLKKYNGTDILNADVYVCGHHGSKNGTTSALLDQITPKYAVISMGDPIREDSWTAWAYGHPNKGILTVLQNKVSENRNPITVQAADGARNFADYTVSKAIYATGWDGNVEAVAEVNGNWNFAGEAGASFVAKKVDINIASEDDLITLPGIGDLKAKAIIDYRKVHGPFKSIKDLAKVPGIYNSVIERIGPHIKF
jgi:competence protein ComEC